MAIALQVLSGLRAQQAHKLRPVLSVMPPVTGAPAGLDPLSLANRSNNDGEAYKVVDVVCPAKRRVLSGGALIAGPTTCDVRMATQAQLLITPSVHRVIAVRNAPDTSCVWSVTGWVLCYKAFFRHASERVRAAGVADCRNSLSRCVDGLARAPTACMLTSIATGLVENGQVCSRCRLR